MSSRSSGMIIARLADPAARLKWLQWVLLIACLVTMSLSAPLWLNARTYPILPISERFPVAGRPWDRLFFGGALLFVALALWKYRWGVAGFLLITLFMALEDQNRWQPWFYLYWTMLLLTLLPAPAALAAGRLALSAVYFWAGVYKCNAKFHDEVVPFFLGAVSGSLPA